VHAHAGKGGSGVMVFSHHYKVLGRGKTEGEVGEGLPLWDPSPSPEHVGRECLLHSLPPCERERLVAVGCITVTGGAPAAGAFSSYRRQCGDVRAGQSWRGGEMGARVRVAGAVMVLFG
jgi:hypothetical protein